MNRGNPRFRGQYSPQFPPSPRNNFSSHSSPYRTPRHNYNNRSPYHQSNQSFNPQWSSSPNYRGPQTNYGPVSDYLSLTDNSGNRLQWTPQSQPRRQGSTSKKKQSCLDIKMYIEPTMLTNPWSQLENQLNRSKSLENPDSSLNQEDQSKS